MQCASAFTGGIADRSSDRNHRRKKVNLLTLPPMPVAIAIGGQGNGIVDLTYVPWLANCAAWYWGDLEVEGFEILSRLRIRFPQTRSFLMGDSTLEPLKDSLTVPGSKRQPPVLPLLTDVEMAAFSLCVADNLRIEQERIPQAAVIDAISRLDLTNKSA